MAARYYPVSPFFWTDEKVKTWDDSTTKLALYLLTSPHRNLEGLYRLPITYAAEDLGWTGEAVEKGLRLLEDAGFVKRDWKAQVVFLCNALKYQAPGTKLQVKGALNALESVPPNSLWDAFWEAVKCHCHALYVAHSEGIDKAFPPKTETA